MCPLLLYDFSQTWNVPIHFRKTLQYQISWKSIQQFMNCYVWMDRHVQAFRCKHANKTHQLLQSRSQYWNYFYLWQLFPPTTWLPILAVSVKNSLHKSLQYQCNWFIKCDNKLCTPCLKWLNEIWPTNTVYHYISILNSTEKCTDHSSNK
jgi:hypothetical protein